MAAELNRDGDDLPGTHRQAGDGLFQFPEQGEREALDQPGGSAGPQEWRPSRQAYYDQLRQVAELEDACHRAGGATRQDAPPGGSVWDLVPAPDRDDITLPACYRDVVLHGHPDHPYEGGHLHGTGRPGVSEFPVGWDERKITDAVLTVARDPEFIAWDDPASYSFERTLGPPCWWAEGEAEGVAIFANIRATGEITDAWPDCGPGVGYNDDPLHPDSWVSEYAREQQEARRKEQQ